MGNFDKKCIFWEGVENSTFKMAKKTIFFDDKILVLRLKKGVQFVWAKLQKFRCPLPPCTEAVHCTSSTSHCPRASGVA